MLITKDLTNVRMEWTCLVKKNCVTTMRLIDVLFISNHAITQAHTMLPKPLRRYQKDKGPMVLYCNYMYMPRVIHLKGGKYNLSKMSQIM